MNTSKQIKNEIKVANNTFDINDIEWEIGDEFDDAGDGHTFFHYATGKNSKDEIFYGNAVLVDGELSDIEEIERAS